MYAIFQNATTVAVGLVSSTGMIGVMAYLLSRANQFCFGYHEGWILGFCCISLLSSYFGVFCIGKMYPRAFRGYVIANAIFTFTLFSLLVTFWTAGASTGDHWWKKNFLQNANKWENVVGCFQKNLFCARHSLKACCQEPATCSSGSSSDFDCFRWSPERSTLCYRCASCMSSTFHRLRADTVRTVGFLVILIFIEIEGQMTSSNSLKIHVFYNFFLRREFEKHAQAHAHLLPHEGDDALIFLPHS